LWICAQCVHAIHNNGDVIFHVHALHALELGGLFHLHLFTVLLLSYSYFCAINWWRWWWRWKVCRRLEH